MATRDLGPSSAYALWLSAGNVGTVEDFLAALAGEDGFDPYIDENGNWVISTGATTEHAVPMSIYDIDIKYNQSASNVTAPSTGWSDTIPSVTQGTYLWTRYIITLADGYTAKSEEYYSVTYQSKDAVNILSGLGFLSSGSLSLTVGRDTTGILISGLTKVSTTGPFMVGSFIIDGVGTLGTITSFQGSGANQTCTVTTRLVTDQLKDVKIAVVSDDLTTSSQIQNLGSSIQQSVTNGTATSKVIFNLDSFTVDYGNGQTMSFGSSGYLEVGGVDIRPTVSESAWW
jgi:hypothetical protein